MSQVNTLFYLPAGPLVPLVTKITTNTATVIVDSRTGQAAAEFSVNENAGATPNLTVDLYDTVNSVSYPLHDTAKKVWITAAVTARQSVEFNSRILPSGFVIRVTSSDAAGKFDVIGTLVGRTRSP